jgi:hypothetical protein
MIPTRQTTTPVLVAVLAILFGAGCAYFSSQPKNRVVQAPTFMSRFTNPGKPEFPIPKTNQSDLWAACFAEQLNDLGGWSPEADWFRPNSSEAGSVKAGLMLTNLIGSVSREFGLTNVPPDYIQEVRTNFAAAASYFTNFSFVPVACDYQSNASGPPFLLGSTNLWKKAMDMLCRIDAEHKMLLNSNKLPTYSKRGDRPVMVSPDYPVGVALSVVHPAEESDSKPNEKGTPPQIMVDSQYQGSGTAPQIMVKSSFEGAKQQATDATATPPVLDFDPTQNVTLTLSTVLNSADVLDRLEYISTFVYLYPYQKPPNAGVSLDREFWRWFFTYQAARNDFFSGNRFYPPDDSGDGRTIHGDTREWIKDD